MLPNRDNLIHAPYLCNYQIGEILSVLFLLLMVLVGDMPRVAAEGHTHVIVRNTLYKQLIIGNEAKMNEEDEATRPKWIRWGGGSYSKKDGDC